MRHPCAALALVICLLATAKAVIINDFARSHYYKDKGSASICATFTCERLASFNISLHLCTRLRMRETGANPVQSRCCMSFIFRVTPRTRQCHVARVTYSLLHIGHCFAQRSRSGKAEMSEGRARIPAVSRNDHTVDALYQSRGGTEGKYIPPLHVTK